MQLANAKLYLSTADPVLKELIAIQPEPDQVSTWNLFHDLISCLVEQQIHYRSSKKLFARLLVQADVTELTPDTFGRFDQRALSTINLSGSKQETIARILDIWQHDTRNWQSLTDTEVRHTLAAIKGVGTWTIDMILLYTLQRPTIFPADDYHLRQVMIKLYKLEPGSRLKSQMRHLACQWGENQSLAVRYLLASKELQKESRN